MSHVVSFRFWRINIISNIFRTFHIVLEENYIAIIIVIELSPSPKENPSSRGAWEPTVARRMRTDRRVAAWEPIQLIFEMLTLCPSLSQAHLRGLVLERSHAALLRSSEHQRSAVGTVHRWRHRHRVSEVRRATPEGDKATSAQSSEHSWLINVLQLPTHDAAESCSGCVRAHVRSSWSRSGWAAAPAVTHQHSWANTDHSGAKSKLNVIVMCINSFTHKSKTTSSERKNFVHFYSKFGAKKTPLVSHAILQNAH